MTQTANVMLGALRMAPSFLFKSIAFLSKKLKSTIIRYLYKFLFAVGQSDSPVFLVVDTTRKNSPINIGIYPNYI